MPRELPETQTLVRELQNFRVRPALAGSQVSLAWRDGAHDLVLALALAAWLGEMALAGEARADD